MNKIHNAIKKIKSSGFFISVFKVGSGQLISQLFALVSVPILSRIYSDAAYGDTALITSTAAILINLSTFGLNSAIMKPADDEEAKKIFTTAFLANLILSTGFTAVYAILVRRIRLFNISGSYGLALLLMWLYCVLHVTGTLMTVYMNRKGKYNRLFFNPIIGSAANFVVAIPLGLLGFGFEGFMVTYIVTSLVSCIHMMWGDVPFSRRYRPKDFLRVFVEYREYVLFQYPSNFIGNLGIEYPTQYLGRVFTTQELGGYSMCVRIMKMPIRLIAAPISTVYFRTATEYHREGKNLVEFTYQMISKIFLISAIPVALFIFISEDLFVFVLGKTWAEAGSLAGFLIIQYVLLFCSQTTSYCRVSIGKQQVDLVVSFARLAVAAISCVVGYGLFRSMKATVFCYSIGQCFFNISDLASSFYCMDKRYFKRYLSISVLYTILMYAIYIGKRMIFA